MMAKLVVVGTGIDGQAGELADAIARRLLGRGVAAVLVEQTEEWAEAHPGVTGYAEYTAADVAAAQADLERSAAARVEYARVMTPHMTAADRTACAYLDGDEGALGMGPRS